MGERVLSVTKLVTRFPKILRQTGLAFVFPIAIALSSASPAQVSGQSLSETCDSLGTPNGCEMIEQVKSELYSVSSL